MKATLNKIESVEKDQYESFIKGRITERSKSIDDIISRTKLPLWNPMSKSSTSKEKMKLQSVKTDCQLFSKLYIGCQSRDGDLDEFFHMKIKALLLRYLTAEESGQAPNVT